MIREILFSVVLVLSLLAQATAQNGTTPGHFCSTLSSAAGKGHDVRLTFLQRVPLGHLVLYLSVWTEDNQLVRCSVNSNPSIAEEYLSLCNEKPDAQTDAAVRRLNISALLLSPNPCTPDVAGEPVSVGLKTERGDGWDPASRTSEVKSRRKRSWLFPGTLWCGAGNRATEYSQLGMFESADKCCREHDHCVHIIPSFTVNYGTFNTNPYTVSHCDCDQRFRQCLLGVNEPISDMVGYSFFNILRVPCFNLVRQKHCTAKSWWGRCKVSKEAPYAVFQKPLSYNTSVVTSKPATVSGKGDRTTCTGVHCVPSDPKRRPKVKPTDASAPTPARCRPREPPRGDTFQPRRSEGKACRKSRKQHVTASVPKRQTPLVAPSTPATSLPRRPRVRAQSGTTGVASGVVVSGSKKIAAGLGETYASLATSKAIPRGKTSSTSVPQTTVSNPEVRVATWTTIAPRRQKNVQMKPRRCSAGASVIDGRSNRLWRKLCLEKTALPHKTATTVPLTVETGSPRQLKTGDKQWSHRTAAAAAAVSTTTQETPPGLSFTIPGIKTSGILSGKADSWDNGNPQRNAIKALEDTESLTGNMAYCTVLKVLDECKYRIPALEEKYGLKNTESKTVYHCDCIIRLTFKMEHIKPTQTILSLLVEFVSTRCFDLPMQKQCLNRKRCDGYFSQAPAAFQGLVEKLEKDTAAQERILQDTKTVIPVRFFKRCMRTVAHGIRR